MMKWIVFATCSALFYLAHDYILKQVSDKIHPTLSSMILTLSATLVLGLIWSFQLSTGASAGKWQSGEIRNIAGAGVLLALATISFIKTFENQAPFSVAIPFIYVVMIALGVVAGVFLLQESLHWKQLLGIVLCCVGLFLVVKK